MNNITNKSRHVLAGLPVAGFDMASAAEGDYTAKLTLMLNSVRNEERANRAAVFASRLEAIASFITKKEMTGIEAAEALRDEATRIQNEAGDFH